MLRLMDTAATPATRCMWGIFFTVYRVERRENTLGFSAFKSDIKEHGRLMFYDVVWDFVGFIFPPVMSK